MRISVSSRVIVLKQGKYCPPRDIWQCLETYLVGRANGTKWMEFKDAAKHPTMHGKPPKPKNYPDRSDDSVRLEKTLLHGEHLTSLASLSQISILFLGFLGYSSY